RSPATAWWAWAAKVEERADRVLATKARRTASEPVRPGRRSHPELARGIPVTFAQYPMDIRLARSLIATLGDDRCIFGYSGRFPDEHSPRLIELGESIHCSCGGPPSSKGRLGYVMVEAYQNMVRHQARIEQAASHRTHSLFMLRCQGPGHV